MINRWLTGCLVLLAAGCSSIVPVSAASQIPEGFVDIAKLDGSILIDIRYFRQDNFVGRRIIGYDANKCILTEEAATALLAAQKELRSLGKSLVVFDCYRPQSAVNDFVTWSNTDDESQKQYYYPNEEKSELFDKGYIADRSGHSRGSTVDVGFRDLKTGRAALGGRFDCRRLSLNLHKAGYSDFGTAFDCFDTLSNTDDRRVTGVARENRQLLKEIMERNGFVNYPLEWWHFTLKDEPYPETYFDFDVR